jgi:hypothetical protein
MNASELVCEDEFTLHEGYPMLADADADFSFTIDFKKGSGDPRRVFDAASELISGFEALDNTVAASLDSKTQTLMVLEDVKPGSLRGEVTCASKAPQLPASFICRVASSLLSISSASATYRPPFLATLLPFRHHGYSWRATHSWRVDLADRWSARTLATSL